MVLVYGRMQYVCPYCGSQNIVYNDLTAEYVCASCGHVVDDSRLVFDSYRNFYFLDDWKKTEEKLRRKRGRWTSSERPDSRTAALVKTRLVELLRNKETWHLVYVVKEYCRPTSLKQLFSDFLKAVSPDMDYRAARRVFEEACRLAGVDKIDLAPTSVWDKQPEYRKRVRDRQVREASERAGLSQRLLEDLRNVPLLQPFDAKAVAEALSALRTVCNDGVVPPGVRVYGVARAVLYLVSLSPLSAKQLSERLGVSKLRVYRALRRLEKLGLVCREREGVYRATKTCKVSKRAFTKAVRVARLIVLSYPELAKYDLSPETIAFIKGVKTVCVAKKAKRNETQCENSTTLCQGVWYRSSRTVAKKEAEELEDKIRLLVEKEERGLEPVKYEEWLLEKTAWELAPKVRRLLGEKEKIRERFRALLLSESKPSLLQSQPAPCCS